MADITADDIMNRDEKLEKFDKHGITEDYLIGKLKEELEASIEIQKKVGKKEITIVKVPIWKIRQDARRDAHKLKGDYPAEKHEHTGDVIFHSNVPEPDMPVEEKKKEEKVGGEYNPKPSTEELTKHLNEFIDEEPPVDKLLEQIKQHHNEEDIEPEEPKPPEEFKDHHRSRRDAGK